jgi:hypothetical protein
MSRPRRSRSVRSLTLAPLLALLAAALAAPACAGEDARRADLDAETSTLLLELKVKMKLLEKLGTDGLRVNVEAAEGGVVTLAGEVKKRDTLELAEEVAKSVEGVARVRNDVRVEGAAPPGASVSSAVAETENELKDAALEVRARLALVDRMGRDGFRIGTDAAGRTLTLEFPAGFERDRRRQAVEIAEKLEGVDRVVELDRK